MSHRTVKRRRAWAAAALGRTAEPVPPDIETTTPFDVVTGRLVDVSSHLITIESDGGQERRLVIAPWATAWHGTATPPADLPVGSQVIVRALHSGTVAEHIWANITRMTGIIRAVRGRRDLTIDLDCGPHRGTRTVVVPYRSSGRIRVRHPQLEPGFLFDAIGLLHDGAPHALLPATSQPPYRADAVPPLPAAHRAAQSTMSGAAVWGDLPEPGVAYPMLETDDTGCDEVGVSCAGLPYLALGSLLQVRNVCDGRAGTLPIVACGCVAGRFCDRCLECGTSPRGRIVELSPLTYVQLGGDLIKGCFNVRIGVG